MSKDAQSEVKTVEVNVLRKVLQKYSDNIFEANRDIEKNRLGKILTIVDSSIADETQRKAMKDLINDAWYSANHTQKVYPQAYQVAEALGFTLWTENPLAVPAGGNQFNPYKELIK